MGQIGVMPLYCVFLTPGTLPQGLLRSIYWETLNAPARGRWAALKFVWSVQ